MSLHNYTKGRDVPDLQLVPTQALRALTALLQCRYPFSLGLSLLPSSLWAPATSSPTITTALVTAAGKPCHPQSSCLHTSASPAETSGEEGTSMAVKGEFAARSRREGSKTNISIWGLHSQSSLTCDYNAHLTQQRLGCTTSSQN